MLCINVKVSQSVTNSLSGIWKGRDEDKIDECGNVSPAPVISMHHYASLPEGEGGIPGKIHTNVT